MAFLFSAIRKSKTHSNISLLLKPRKDSQSFIQGAGFAFAALGLPSRIMQV